MLIDRAQRLQRGKAVLKEKKGGRDRLNNRKEAGLHTSVSGEKVIYLFFRCAGEECST